MYKMIIIIVIKIMIDTMIINRTITRKIIKQRETRESCKTRQLV